MSTGNYPVKKTGSADNERLQINKALESIFQVLSRADQWDQAVSWGDHSQEGYASALSELSAFADLGVPANLTLSTTLEKLPSGNETHSIEASWTKAGDSSIVYDLEIRECDPSTVVDDTSPSDIIANTTLYSIPIVSNDVQESIIKYRSFFEPDVRYFFRVRIRQNILVSNWSAFENITTSPSADIPPAPTSLTATSYIDAVKLTWDYAYVSNPDVAKIEILRDSVVIDDVPRPAKQYIDASLDEGVTYAYQVRAVTFNGTNSVLSSTINGKTVQSTVTIRSTTQPSTRPDGSPLKPGDIWIETDNGDRPYTYNGTSFIGQYTAIPGNNLNNGTVSSSKFATDLTSDNYSAGTAGWKIERDTGSVEFNDIIARGTVASSNYSAGTTGWEINNSGTAEFNSVTARGSFTAGVVSPTEDRIELTPSGTYRIWVGSNTKNDSNGVFWVKSDGSAKIDKSTFGIPDGGFSVGVAVGSGTANQTSNTAALSTGLITIVKSITVEASILFGAFVVQDENFFGGPGSAVPLCDPTLGNITGTLALERSTDNINWTLVDAAPFASGGVCYYITDPDPSILDQRQIVNNIDATKTLVNTPPTPGNYYYRVLYSSWSSYFLSAQTNLNDLTIRFIY